MKAYRERYGELETFSGKIDWFIVESKNALQTDGHTNV
jgi:hypothetical protein